MNSLSVDLFLWRRFCYFAWRKTKAYETIGCRTADKRRIASSGS